MSKLTIAENATTPASPTAGRRAMYPKADGLWYTVDSAGTETLLAEVTTTQLALKANIAAPSFTGNTTHQGLTETVVTNGTGTYTISLAAATVFHFTVATAITLPVPAIGKSFRVLNNNPPTSWTPSSGALLWDGAGGVPTVTGKNEFVFTSDGTNWIGHLVSTGAA